MALDLHLIIAGGGRDGRDGTGRGDGCERNTVKTSFHVRLGKARVFIRVTHLWVCLCISSTEDRYPNVSSGLLFAQPVNNLLLAFSC